ncbi:UvrD-helicase domain-containing protein [Zafaria sp. J156]|uniref:UvrD-helicase domain-containing protein n=1 Tax=Zafaria sp. J156 TaxID=3116490 RepID=UPI002E76ED27|nr:UvrD-helicase domain-containing protein [Zafaria sp. J156]MEE1622017.1 UvrD-helicase domain-containing protein [Zafaria sp. J156]
MPESPSPVTELELERSYVAGLYERLDELREEKTRQLARVRRGGAVGSLQNVSERDAFATMYEDRLAQLNAVEDRLVFGRLDLEGANGASGHGNGDDAGASATTRYIGRIGLTDREQSRLMIDWRAPEAGAFYQATAFERHGVRRRRHLILKGRNVVALEDDVLDPELLSEQAEHQGEGALLAALRSKRTGRMADIVSTIQAEQDRIIRSELAGVLVVQGGPGTGKTAVALHRAAFLLYQHRERLKSAGVLLVGPSSSFMRYIERVLPSLGETGVVMASLGRLMPGIRAVPEPGREAARIKGRIGMADVVARAVANRQRLPDGDRRVVVEGTPLVLTPRQVRRARDKARATHKPHNEARTTFVKILVRELAEQLRDKLEESSGTGNSVDRAYLSEDVRSSRDVRIALNLCWLPMTPEKLIAELYAKPELLAAVAPELSATERAALRRDPGAPWTEADVPLLDEAAELLGELDASAGRDAAQREAEHQRDVANATQALENVDSALREIGVDGILDAEDLAAMNQEGETVLTAAERASQDRNWAYGHVVVDEAQELSPMQWRLLMRRCPLKSFTVVGDIAQASSAASATSWAQAMAPFVGERFTLEELTVNYRTPTQIAEAAARMAQAAGLVVSTPKAVREGRWAPVVDRVPADGLRAALAAALPEEVGFAEGGLTAVIAPASRLRGARATAVELYGRRVGTGSGGLEQDIVVTTAQEAKGLEFDVVLLLEPDELIAEADGGFGDLYVAMTRATQRLRILAEGRVPDGIVAD